MSDRNILGIIILNFDGTNNNLDVEKHKLKLEFINIMFRFKVENRIVENCKELVEALYEEKIANEITSVHMDGEIGTAFRKHNLNDVVCHCCKKDYIYCVITHNNFKMSIVKKVMDELNSVLYMDVLDLDYMLDKYDEMDKNTQKDKITEIQDDLDEAVDVLKISMEKLLSRGEQLEELLEKTENLREVSFKFQKQARKLNSCCLIL